jgi:hypothetical protein
MRLSRFQEAPMDNRLNKIRKEMNVLRGEMLRAEEVMRAEVNHDRDCTETALGLMAMRAKMRLMVGEWTRLGGMANLPTVEERLKERRLSNTFGSRGARGRKRCAARRGSR